MAAEPDGCALRAHHGRGPSQNAVLLRGISADQREYGHLGHDRCSGDLRGVTAELPGAFRRLRQLHQPGNCTVAWRQPGRPRERRARDHRQSGSDLRHLSGQPAAAPGPVSGREPGDRHAGHGDCHCHARDCHTRAEQPRQQGCVN